MNFKKIIPFLMLGYAYSASAEPTHVVIELNSDEQFQFNLNDSPVFTHSNGNLVVNGSSSTSYAISEVKNFHFFTSEDSKAENLAKEMLQIIAVDDNTIEVHNIPEQVANVELVNAAGMVLNSYRADSEHRVTISLPRQAGVYIMVAGNKSFKIVRK